MKKIAFNLIKIANHCDRMGLYREAADITNVIKKLCQSSAPYSPYNLPMGSLKNTPPSPPYAETDRNKVAPRRQGESTSAWQQRKDHMFNEAMQKWEKYLTQELLNNSAKYSLNNKNPIDIVNDICELAGQSQNSMGQKQHSKEFLDALRKHLMSVTRDTLAIRANLQRR